MKLCHYTADEGAEKIIRSGTIQASLKSNGDAALGNGVYLTKLMPTSSTKAQVAQNNWGSTDDESMRKTKNVFVLEIPDREVRNVSTSTRNIYLLGGYKDLYLHKYKWYLQDDTGKIIASYRYHIESTGPVNIPLHEFRDQFKQEYVMKDKIYNGRPVYKLKKTGRLNRAKIRFFCLELDFEYQVEYLFMTRNGNWMVGKGEGFGWGGGWLRQEGNYSLGPCAAGAWEYWDSSAGELCWKKVDPTIKSYPWYNCSEWKTAKTPAATTALSTVTTSSTATSSASTTSTPAGNPATTAGSPLPPPVVQPPPLSPTHLPPTPTLLNPPSPDMMRRSVSLPSLPAQSSQDGLHSQDQSALMISPISQIPSGGTPMDSALGTPGGSNYNTSEGASPQYSTPVASTPVIAPSAVKPVEEKGPSGGQAIKQITLKSHHPSLKERQSGIIAVLYGAHDVQCKSCGMRYSEDADLTEEQLQKGEFEGEDGEKHVSSTSMDKTLVCDGAGEGASVTQHRKDDDNSPDGAVGLPVSSQLGEMATEIMEEVMQLQSSFQKQEDQDKRFTLNS